MSGSNSDSEFGSSELKKEPANSATSSLPVRPGSNKGGGGSNNGTSAIRVTSGSSSLSSSYDSYRPRSRSSRREGKPEVPGATSVYGNEAQEVPSWVKKEKPVDKYDKYGARPTVNSRVGGGEESERYSKYISRSSTTSTNRVKRPYEEEEYNSEEERRYGSEAPENSEAAPYSNLDVVNQAHDHLAHQNREYSTFRSHINNREERDINSIVRTHYNQRAHHSKKQLRKNSPIIKMRNFNNAIKYILLGNFAKREEGSDKPFTILDLCCGKGGDLNKCQFINIEQYIGIDISDVSVKEAFARYSQRRVRFRPAHNQAPKRDDLRFHFEACFATGDCFTKTVPEMLEPNFPGIIDKTFPVDTVSVQFALHYAFETEEKVRTFLTNVSRSLRPGGTFIGTIPSSDFIRKKIVTKSYLPNAGDKKRFGNSLYSVTFDKEPPEDGVFRPPFGNKYNYSLKDAIDDVPEYVVPFETLRALCEDYGMELKYKKNFVDIFNQEIPKYFTRLSKNLIEGMKRSDGKYGAEGEEKEAVGFYIGFVFEKLGS
ncbi:mRNA cap guanine-N7 methyltransferase [Scheffersomyces xylosifermentans]|uniref:mRNA cap guanine-N7 methyltransferase n=1 Tax=Scheffersomyces xylosifermentans TaxID=1304137 RepID=UPI00315C990E